MPLPAARLPSLPQNFFDDVASILEKICAVLTFQDVVASWLFVIICLVLLAVFHFVGFTTTMFLVLLWQVRPPKLRDALPPPPVSYFLRLPSRSPEDMM